MVQTLQIKFFTFSNFLNILEQSSTTGILAIGLTFVLLTGGMDLSGPAIMALSAVLGTHLMVEYGSHWIVGAFVMPCIGLLLGCFNGFAVSYLGMLPFLVSLSTMTVYGGFALWFTDAQSIYGLPENYIFAFTKPILGIPTPIFILFISGFLGQFILNKTILGRWIYLVGVNKTAAYLAGVPIRIVLLISYSLSGFFAGLTALILSARLESASAGMGGEMVIMDVISGAAMGGVSLYGGSGNMVGAIIGTLFVTLIENIMNIIDLSSYISMVIKGIIIIIAVIFNRYFTHRNCN